jgi:hypothetical protein
MDGTLISAWRAKIWSSSVVSVSLWCMPGDTGGARMGAFRTYCVSSWGIWTIELEEGIGARCRGCDGFFAVAVVVVV